MDEGALPSMSGIQNLNQTNNISGGSQFYQNQQDFPGLSQTQSSDGLGLVQQNSSGQKA